MSSCLFGKDSGEILEVIMLNDLSEDAIKLAIGCSHVDAVSKRKWRLTPIAYTRKKLGNQDEIDYEALSQIGFYEAS